MGEDYEEQSTLDGGAEDCTPSLALHVIRWCWNAPGIKQRPLRFRITDAVLSDVADVAVIPVKHTCATGPASRVEFRSTLLPSILPTRPASKTKRRACSLPAVTRSTAPAPVVKGSTPPAFSASRPWLAT